MDIQHKTKSETFTSIKTNQPWLSLVAGASFSDAFGGIGIAFLYPQTLKIDKLSILYLDFFVDSDSPNDQHKLTSRRNQMRCKTLN